MRIRYPLIAMTSVLMLVAALLIGSASASATDAQRRPECTIIGTDGNDELHGTTGPDVICAGPGNDQVFGRAGDDVIFLGAGDDYFNDGAGDDRVYGGPDSDYALARRGDDRIFLQGGRDLFQSSVLEKRFPSGTDLIVGGRRRDHLSAEDAEGNDHLRGGPDRDTYCADTGDVVRSVEVGDPFDCQEWVP